ncbi:MAG: SDR family NAD(P)-dependent oxidoreductase [Bdellovibrionales bacterium]
MKRVLITGASSGIGKAAAHKFAAAGASLILLARRDERLQALKKELLQKYKIEITTAVVDVQKSGQVDKFVSDHKSLLKDVDVLINNAGLAKGTEKMMDAKVTDWDAMLDTNVKGLLYVTRAILPFMIATNKGHIINIGSIAGRWVYPGGAVYCASKFAVRAISEGLRMDLLGTALRVTNIEPGMVETEFSEVRLESTERAKAVYRGMKPLSAADISESIFWCAQLPAHVNIQELVIMPVDQAAIQLVHRREAEKPT